MPRMEMICLANSRKLQGRCIAGLRTDGQGWMRPVPSGLVGSLSRDHYRLPNGTEPRLLDVISIGCVRPQATQNQPENWLIDGIPWKLAARPASVTALSLLRSHMIAGPDLFGNMRDRVNYDALSAAPISYSLALIAPENLHWNILTTARGNRQTRASFSLAGCFYNLSVTDPVWERHLDHLPIGPHSDSVAGLEANQQIFLTISLGEPTAFDNCCYKLVAAVIVAPR